jgi:ketosteroid isomerase-like protein
MAHPNEDVVRRAFAAFAAGDQDGLRQVFDPDVVWHQGGHNPLAGSYEGVEEVLRLFGDLQERTDGSLRTDVHDVVGGDQHVFAAFVATARRGGKSLRDGEVLVCHVRDGRISEAWLMTGDQYLVDAFWS